MKNIFAIILVIAILPLSLVSKPDKQLSDLNHQKKPQTPPTSFILKDYPPVSTGKTSDLPQKVNYKIIDFVDDANFSFNYGVTPFVYDPISNSMIIVLSHRYVPENAERFSDSLYLLYSNNDGGSWNKKLLQLSTGVLYMNSSLATVNPGNESYNFNDLDHFVVSRYMPYNPLENNYSADGSYYLYKLGDDIQSWNSDKLPTSTQQWGFSKLASFSSPNSQMAYRYGVLTPNEGYQYGHYGFGSFDFLTEGDNNTIPTAWDITKYRPSEHIGSSYNNKMYLDTDEDGVIYAAVSNMFANDPDNRTVGISRSADNGNTWLEFEKMPISLLDNYCASETESGAYGVLIAYEEDGFAVTGEDEFSYVCKVRILNSARNAIIGQHLIEMYKQNETWGIRKVADYGWFSEQGFSYSPLVVFDHNPDRNSNTFMDSLDENSRGMEIQLSKTADGQYIIAKWLDWNVDRPIDVNYKLLNGENIGSLYTTDIYMAYRRVDEDQWSAARNVTDDDFYNKLTFIPSVVPSINNIPLLSLHTVEITNTQYPRYGYPPILNQMLVDQNVPQYIAYSNVSDLLGVENESPVKNFALNDVYPNPVTSNAEISFTLDKPAISKLELYNSLGERVLLLQEGFLSSGTHAVNVNTSNLTSGVYYYTLTVEGKTATKILCLTK